MLPAAVIMTLALEAAVHPNLQGIIITAMVLGLFVMGMTLAPRMRPRSVTSNVLPRAV
jgi:hypothetical protein